MKQTIFTNRRRALIGGACLLAGGQTGPVLAKPPAAIAPGFVDVRGFGAKADGETNDAPAINQAIT